MIKMKLELKGKVMKNLSMESNSIYGENFESQRQEREVEKYGQRLPIPEMAAHPHRYNRHSIEPAYGLYDRPINESV